MVLRSSIFIILFKITELVVVGSCSYLILSEYHSYILNYVFFNQYVVLKVVICLGFVFTLWKLLIRWIQIFLYKIYKLKNNEIVK